MFHLEMALLIKYVTGYFHLKAKVHFALFRALLRGSVFCVTHFAFSEELILI